MIPPSTITAATANNTVPTTSSPRILLLGCGGVQQSLLTIFETMMPNFLPKNLIIVDKEDRTMIPPVQAMIAKGATFVQIQVTRQNVHSVLSGYVGNGDQIIDLTVGIGCSDVIQWCLGNNVRYINTACKLFFGVW
jgi:homospermidine synthase